MLEPVSLNQPVLSNEGKVSWPRKQRKLLMGVQTNASTDYKSEALIIALCHLFNCYIKH